MAYLDLQKLDDLPAFGRGVAVRCDVTDRESVESAFTHVEQELGTADLLICSAGILRTAPVVETTDEMLHSQFEVNVGGTFRCIRRALPAMRARGRGRILVIASAAGLSGGSPGLSAYATTKGAVITLTQAVAREALKDGVTVNAVAPAMIETPMVDGIYDEAAPVGRTGHPVDVTRIALALLADQADYMTGEIVRVDGGLHLR